MWSFEIKYAFTFFCTSDNYDIPHTPTQTNTPHTLTHMHTHNKNPFKLLIFIFTPHI